MKPFNCFLGSSLLSCQLIIGGGITFRNAVIFMNSFRNTQQAFFEDFMLLKLFIRNSNHQTPNQCCITLFERFPPPQSKQYSSGQGYYLCFTCTSWSGEGEISASFLVTPKLPFRLVSFTCCCNKGMRYLSVSKTPKIKRVG